MVHLEMITFANNHGRDITPHSETVNTFRDFTLIHEDASSVAADFVDGSFCHTILQSPSLVEEGSDNWSLQVNYDSTSRSMREGFDEMFDYASPLSMEGGVDNSLDYEHYVSAPSPAERSYYLDYASAPFPCGKSTTELTDDSNYGSNSAVPNTSGSYVYGFQLSVNDNGANMTAILQSTIDFGDQGTQQETWEDDDTDATYTFTERLEKREHEFRAGEGLPRTCSDGHCHSL